jgi:excisionase family DNA binding protein
MSEPSQNAVIEPQSASRANGSSAPKGLHTVQGAAAKLNLPPSWLYERTRKHEIPFRRFGKYIRFTDDDLDAIIALAQTVGELTANNRIQTIDADTKKAPDARVAERGA